MPQTHPILFYAAAGALALGGPGAGWYVWQRGQQEAAKRLQHEDAEAAKQALVDGIELSVLRRKARAEGLDPEEVIAGYTQLRDAQLSPDDVLQRLSRAEVSE